MYFPVALTVISGGIKKHIDHQSVTAMRHGRLQLMGKTPAKIKPETGPNIIMIRVTVTKSATMRRPVDSLMRPLMVRTVAASAANQEAKPPQPPHRFRTSLTVIHRYSLVSICCRSPEANRGVYLPALFSAVWALCRTYQTAGTTSFLCLAAYI